jgi:hypothetical protein
MYQPSNENSKQHENYSVEFIAHLTGGLVSHYTYNKVEKIIPQSIFKHSTKLFFWKSAAHLAATAVGYGAYLKVKDSINQHKPKR